MTTEHSADPLVSWSDVVYTLRDSGEEHILLGAADLAVHDGETICLVARDGATRNAVIALLTGQTRPHYGIIKGTGQRRAGTNSGTAVQVAVRRGGRAATVVVAADASEVPWATRAMSVVRGGFQPVASPRRWPVADIRSAVIKQLSAAGAPAPTATLVAGVLVDADVRGHHSHGIELLPMYLNRVQHGGIDPIAQPSWVTRGSVVHVLSGNGGFGQLGAHQAAEACAQAAAEHGLAAVAVRDNNHVGMLAAYRQPFIDRGIIALILNISGPSVAPPGAGKASLGNDAVCVIAPGDGSAPLIADFATGAVASGKIRDIGTRGGQVPDGWLLGPDGRPSANPADLDRGGSVPVFGGSATGHKGLCVTVLTEVLAGMLAGATISPRVNKQRQHPELAMGCSQMFLGFSPAAFAAGDITELTTALMGAVAGAYGQAGPPAVYFPEQLEQLRAREAEQGIEVPPSLAARLGLVVT